MRLSPPSAASHCPHSFRTHTHPSAHLLLFNGEQRAPALYYPPPPGTLSHAETIKTFSECIAQGRYRHRRSAYVLNLFKPGGWGILISKSFKYTSGISPPFKYSGDVGEDVSQWRPFVIKHVALVHSIAVFASLPHCSSISLRFPHSCRVLSGVLGIFLSDPNPL